MSKMKRLLGDTIYVMPEQVDIVKLTEFEIAALQIIDANKGIQAKQFAKKFWPKSPMHRTTTMYNASYCGGVQLRRLWRKGLLLHVSESGRKIYKVSEEAINQLSYVNWNKHYGQNNNA